MLWYIRSASVGSFWSVVYIRTIVYKRQNFLKVVVNVIIIANVIKPHVWQNPGYGYL